MAVFDLRPANSEVNIGGVRFTNKGAFLGSGTGGYGTFLALTGPGNDTNSEGFNSDDVSPQNPGNPDIDLSKTEAIRLSGVPIKTIDGTQYYEIRLDLNEPNSNDTVKQVSLDLFKLYVSTNGGIESLADLAAQGILKYDLDAGGDNWLQLFDVSSGSGTDDYSILIPVSLFAGVDPLTNFLYVHVGFGAQGGDFEEAGGFEEFNIENAGTLTGFKFSDINSDGAWDPDGVNNIAGDADDEVGVGGVTIYVDANLNGILDAGERQTVTAGNGSYSFFGMPLGTYRIDEIIPAGATQTTGPFETATISTAEQVVVVDPIGNHFPVPNFTIDKTVTDVDGGGPGGIADEAGDIITYRILLTNNGELTLTGVTVTDPFADTLVRAADAIGDNDNDFEVGEQWVFTATHTVTQAEIDSNGGGDGDLDNTAVGDTDQVGPKDDSEDVPIDYDPQLAIDKVVQDVGGDGAAGEVDAAGDVITYDITVTNTGNVTLHNVTVTDPLTGTNINVGTLAPGASTTVQDQTYVAQQSDLDNNGGGDGDIDNTSTADSDETGPVQDSEEVPVAPAPALAIDKVVQDVGGDGAGGSVDAAGDVITYDITVTNTGNVTLNNVTVTDPLTGTDINIGSLAPGASFTVEDQTYTALQSDLDDNGGGDGDIDNTSTGDSDQTGPVDDSEEVPIVQNAILLIDKIVQDVGGEGPGGTAGVGDVITYDILVTNDGNVTLTNVIVTDPLTGTNINIGTLDPGESFTVEDQTYPVQQSDIDTNGGGDGDIDNTATADSDQTDPVQDSEEVPLEQGPGVRTPGFWQNPNNGGLFWDGIVGNEPKAGQPGFPEGELTYPVDSNGDGIAGGPGDLAGLLIGDYNTNGIEDAGEDTLFIDLRAAQAFVNGGGGSDGREKIGRDVVATWLNFLSGNPIGTDHSGDGKYSPREAIDDAVDWLQVFADGNNNGINFVGGKPELFGPVVKANSAAWKNDNAAGVGVESGNDIHNALDEYNNFGTINGIQYATDADFI